MSLKQENKLVIGTQMTTATSNSTVAVNFDCLGFSRAQVELIVSAPNVTHAPATLKLGQGTTTDASNFTDISAFAAGTGFTAVTASTSTAAIYKFDVDMRGLERYLRLTYTPNAAQSSTAVTTTAIAHLFRANLGASGATAQGVTQVVSG